jgi:alpha-beta hydrolase superfamily lysophospholipase
LAAEAGFRDTSLTSRDGTRLHARIWPVDQPRVWLAIAHGLGEHSGRYERLARAMSGYRIGCYAVDLRGMGRSEGRRGHLERWQQWVDDYACFYQAVLEDAGGTEVVPLGHSFGGLVVVSAVLSGAVDPSRFVLSNPAFRAAVEVPSWKLRLGRAASRLVPALTMANEVDPALISRDPSVVDAYRNDSLVHDRISARLFVEWSAASEQALARAPEIKLPFLLIVGSDDRLIDPQGAAEFSSRVTVDHTTRLYPGRYHEPFNDLGADEVFADLAGWLERSD